MSGLTDQAGGKRGSFSPGAANQAAGQARQAWAESMQRQIDTLRLSLQTLSPQHLAADSGSSYDPSGGLSLEYWGDQIQIAWPALEAVEVSSGTLCSVFDTAMLLYYLSSASRALGVLPAGQWISFRELPGGGFYHQAFQGYSGDRLAQAFGDIPEAFVTSAHAQGGWRLQGIGEFAFGFQPLPRIRLAAFLWPGDEEFPTRASILFDAAASRYMIVDGLALLGAGLASRLIAAHKFSR